MKIEVDSGVLLGKPEAARWGITEEGSVVLVLQAPGGRAIVTMGPQEAINFAAQGAYVAVNFSMQVQAAANGPIVRG